ncbi:unnamed protein product, partial [marine sediment metagenome]
ACDLGDNLLVNNPLISLNEENKKSLWGNLKN